MSVLASQRSKSYVEYVSIADQIYISTLDFMTHISNRYSRLIANKIMELASDLLTYTESANSTKIANPKATELYMNYLLQAKAALNSLDIHLAHCVELMMMNPQGCFQNKDKVIDKSKAQQKISKICYKLGCFIDEEDQLLSNLITNQK